jgi:hypothetical protein
MQSTLTDIFLSPKQAFFSLNNKPRFLWVLLLQLALLCSLNAGYFLLNDSQFIVDQIVGQALLSQPNVSEADIRANLDNVPMTLLMSSSLLGVIFIVPITYLAQSLYFLILEKISGGSLTLKSCYTLIVWSSMPALIKVIAGWMMLVLSGGDGVSQAAINPLSFDSLLGLNSKSTFFQQFGLTSLWTFVLLVMGWYEFKKSSWAAALMSVGILQLIIIVITGVLLP